MPVADGINIMKSGAAKIFFLFAALFLFSSLCADESDALQQKARNGDIAAQLKLADEYFFGKNRRPLNPVLAVYWFRRAADAGNANAQYNLAVCYDKGWGVEKNPLAAAHFFRLSSAKLPQAKVRYAEKLYFGHKLFKDEKNEFPELKADPKAALQLLRDTAKVWKEAYFSLAKLLYLNTPLHAAELFQVLDKYAPDSNNPDALIMYSACLRAGIGCLPDPAAGAKYLERAAALNHPDAIAQLAEIIELGTGLPRDPERAIDLEKRAIKLGSPRALCNHGERYLTGNRVTSDPVKAFELFQQAANKNYPPAIYQLGQCYAMGIGVEPDEQKALNYFLKASDMGNGEASFEVAKRHRDGRGISKSEYHYHAYLERAAAAGNISARRLLGAELLRRNDPRDRRRGQQILLELAAVGDRAAQAILQGAAAF